MSQNGLIHLVFCANKRPAFPYLIFWTWAHCRKTGCIPKRKNNQRTFRALGRSGFNSTIESNLSLLYLNMNIPVSYLSLLFEYELCSSIILPPPPSIGILFCADDAKPQGNKVKSRMHSDGFKRLPQVNYHFHPFSISGMRRVKGNCEQQKISIFPNTGL